MALTFGSVSYGDLNGAVTNTATVAGKYWWSDPKLGPKIYDRRDVAYPGMDGIFIKKFGYRGRILIAQVIYINATYNGVKVAFETDQNTLANSLFTMTMPWGTAYQNTDLKDMQMGLAAATHDGKHVLMGTVIARHTGN